MPSRRTGICSLALAAALLVLAPALRIPYPILLVLGGIAFGFVPGMPEVELPPDLVLVAGEAVTAQELAKLFTSPTPGGIEAGAMK